MLFILLMIQFIWLVMQFIYLYSEHYIDRLSVVNLRELYRLPNKFGPDTILPTDLNWSNVIDNNDDNDRFVKAIHWWQNWTDTTPIVNLPIRGTHHSPTYTINNVIGLFAKTQKYTLLQQLNRGIRLFDIRLKLNEKTGKLWAYHDFVDLNLSWAKIWRTFHAWLQDFPHEGILLLIRDENYRNHGEIARRAVQELDETVRKQRIVWNNNDFTATETLTVEQLRGKMFLVNQNGENALSWADNRNFVVGNVRVGDQYEVENAEQKVTVCVRFYSSIGNNDVVDADTDNNANQTDIVTGRKTQGYLNILFTSIANKNPFTSIQNIASRVNQEFVAILQLRKLPIYGCALVQDWIE